MLLANKPSISLYDASEPDNSRHAIIWAEDS